MFRNVFGNRPDLEESSHDFEFERSNREPISFNGELLFQSKGISQPAYKSESPYHDLAIYAVADGGFAIIVSFHSPSTAKVSRDGELFDDVNELDDYFIIYAAEFKMEHAELNDDVSEAVAAAFDAQASAILKSVCKSIEPSSYMSQTQPPKKYGNNFDVE